MKNTCESFVDQYGSIIHCKLVKPMGKPVTKINLYVVISEEQVYIGVVNGTKYSKPMEKSYLVGWNEDLAQHSSFDVCFTNIDFATDLAQHSSSDVCFTNIDFATGAVFMPTDRQTSLCYKSILVPGRNTFILLQFVHNYGIPALQKHSWSQFQGESIFTDYLRLKIHVTGQPVSTSLTMSLLNLMNPSTNIAHPILASSFSMVQALPNSCYCSVAEEGNQFDYCVYFTLLDPIKAWWGMMHPGTSYYYLS